MRRSEKGFEPVQMILIIVGLCLIAFIAWRIIEANGTVQQTADSIPNNVVVPQSTAAVTPTNTDDLNTLQNQLDTTTVDDSSTTQLDTQSTF